MRFIDDWNEEPDGYLVRFTAKECHSGEGAAPDHRVDVDRSGADGRAIRRARSSDLVGVQLGHHGARHVFRHVRHLDGVLRLLRAHQTGLARLVS